MRLVSPLLLFVPLAAFSQQLAFPGAEGHGRYTTGGRGGAVIEVTNLNDSGAGSLRAAISASGPRTIVFRVSGTIYLNSALSIKNGNLTIAGQTAPGDGITIARQPLKIDKADNVIIRYIRVRLGDLFPRAYNLTVFESDAFECMYATNIIIDHCTFSWSTDEVASAYNNKNFTMQWCIASEALHNSFHSKGNHGYGGIWGGKNATFHHNLIAHHRSRLPRFNGARYADYAEWGDGEVDHRHNVIYNWGDNSCYGGEPNDDGFQAHYNIVGNAYRPGPATYSSRRDRIIEVTPGTINNRSRFHVAGNYVFGTLATCRDNWQGVDNVPADQLPAVRAPAPFAMPPVAMFPALEAYEQVLAHAGASFPKRDSVDERVVNEVRTGTFTYGNSGHIDSQDQVGGYPLLESLPAPDDTDRDGMPDEWENAHGLSATDPLDRNGDRDGDGYTNLEEYLNRLVEPAFGYGRVLGYGDWAPLAVWDPLLPAGMNDDPDHDLAGNLYEFAFNGNPLVNDAHLISPALAPSREFHFIHRKGTALHYAVQSSGNLADWATVWQSGDSLDNARIQSVEWGYHADRITFSADPQQGEAALFWRVMVNDESLAP